MAYTIINARHDGMGLPPEMIDNIYFEAATGRVFLIVAHKLVVFRDIGQNIGSGGMGRVFIGKNFYGDEKLAIKEVHARYANIPDIRQRARKEAAYQFNHPHLIEMLGCVESLSGTGPIYVVSRYVNGENIDVHIGHLTFPDNVERQARIVGMLMPALDALEYLHKNNILHLDIKPSNIMMEGGRNIRLMDLGIATVEQRRAEYASATPNQNGGSGLAGTPKYAAPEQFNMGQGGVTAAADIYAFGVSLYELLSGINPFEATDLDETLRMHCETALPRSSQITAPLLKVLRRATDPDPAQRYQTVDELRIALFEATRRRNWFERMKDKLNN